MERATARAGGGFGLTPILALSIDLTKSPVDVRKPSSTLPIPIIRANRGLCTQAQKQTTTPSPSLPPPHRAR